MSKKKGMLAWTSALGVMVLVGMACSLVSGLMATRTPLPPTRKSASSTPHQPAAVTLTASAPTAVFAVVEPRAHPQAQGLSMGDPKALVTVMAYGDFQCPACQHYVISDEPFILTEYISTSKAYYPFVPFSFIDEYPRGEGGELKHAAEAAYCASEQGKFWEYHDILYANQASENSGGFSDDRLTGMAAVIGQDMTRFNTCNTAHRYQQQVLDDEKISEQAGVSKMLSFMVNG